MTTTFDGEQIELPAHAHKLRVHAAFECDEEGERRLRGWVDCPQRGPIELDRCTACSRCRGVLLEPRLHGPEVLCTFDAHREAVTAAAETARAWALRPALGVTPETPIKELGVLMLEYGADALLIVSPRGESLGVADARTVVAAMLAGHANDAAAACMQRIEDVVPSDMSMVDASEKMRQRGVHVLPLADAGGHIVGMLTRADVLRWALRHDMPQP